MWKIRLILFTLNILKKIDWSWFIVIIFIVAILLVSWYQQFDLMIMAILYPNEEQIGQRFSFINPVWPIMNHYTITSPYGLRNDPFSGEKEFHEGIDISAPRNAPVFAISDGRVIASSLDEKAGGYIILEHDIEDLVNEDEQSKVKNLTLITKYLHLNQSQVSVGDKVKAGQLIALSGNTGESTGPHLDFRIVLEQKGKENYIDPKMVMSYPYQIDPIIFDYSLNLAEQAAEKQDEEDEPFNPDWVMIKELVFDKVESEEQIKRQETRAKVKVKVYEVALTDMYRTKKDEVIPIKNEFGIHKKKVEFGRYITIELELRRKLKINDGVKELIWELNEKETVVGDIKD